MSVHPTIAGLIAATPTAATGVITGETTISLILAVGAFSAVAGIAALMTNIRRDISDIRRDIKDNRDGFKVAKAGQRRIGRAVIALKHELDRRPCVGNHGACSIPIQDKSADVRAQDAFDDLEEMVSETGDEVLTQEPG
jgi:hypothetical protein